MYISNSTPSIAMGKTKHSNKIPATEAASSSSVLPPPPWIELPGDVTANILQRLGAKERLESAQLVCTTWRRVCLDPAMWRVIELIPPDNYDAGEYRMMCRCMVDRSQGQLIDLRIFCFCDDSLLSYISDHSSHLQRLTIGHSFDISGMALSESVKKFPQLQELHLIMVRSISAKDIESIGISCPMLKSFSYHWGENPMHPHKEQPAPNSKLCNEYALAIGETMPNLLHLQLFANPMKNEGLEAVLDGCPLLESLDIRKCLGLDLEGALGRRFFQQIKNRTDPSDNICDFEWFGFDDESDSSQCSDFES